MLACLSLYTSVVTLALALVTLTLSSLARAMMDTRLRDDTLCAILKVVSVVVHRKRCTERYALCGKGFVVHEQELEVLRVLDEKRLVAGRHHVLGLFAVDESVSMSHDKRSPRRKKKQQ